MVFVETSFPRGGSIKPAEPSTSSDIVFGARQEKKKSLQLTKKQREKERKLRNETKDDNIEATSAELLNHKTIQEGMIIMGSVKSTDPTFVQISLPGRIVGKVLASNISDSYTKVLKTYVESNEKVKNFKLVNELFHVGQIVYVKVMQITNFENGNSNIILSLKPSDVHSDMYHEGVRKGMLFNGAVAEFQDHGFIIESGIKNLRCFLPSENVTEKLSLGELVFLKIEKLTQANTASTAICKTISLSNRKIKDISDPKLDYIIPSTIVNFTVTKILKNGIQGTIMNDTFKGYINEHHLSLPLSVPDDIKMNAKFNARVLYIMPLTKFVYLSLKSFENVDNKITYSIGQIIEDAHVHHIGTGGIILKLGDNLKGLISFKSIKTNYVGNYDQDEILSKYQKNSKHKVRIIEYDEIDSLYICTDNPSVVNEKFFTISDINPGDFVTGIVIKKVENGNYWLSIGKLKGVLEPIFMTSSSLNEKSKVRCRVLGTNPEKNTIFLTNRVEYMMKDAKILMDISNAKKNKIFLGTIVKCCDGLVVIKFFNNLQGVLFKKFIKDSILTDKEFFVGQTMLFRIISQKHSKLVVALPDDVHGIGDISTAKITNIIQNGLEILIDDDDNNLQGLVPIRLLSDFPDLVTLKINSYNIDDTVKVACITSNIFSIRDVDYFEKNPIKKWQTIQNGDILKGFVKNVDNEIIEIVLPIRNYDKIIKIHWKMFITNCIVNSSIVVVPDQVVYVKIISKEDITKTLTVSAKFTDIWNGDLKTTGEWFASYLNEIEEIRYSFKTNKKSLGNYEIGNIYTGKVLDQNQETNDCYIEFPDNVRGIIKRTILSKQTLPKDKEIKCIVLWIDYLNEILYLSNKSHDIEHISKETILPENLIGKNGLNAKILIKLNEVIICSLKKGKQPLVFVPTKLHFNDFENTIAHNIKEGDFCRLALIHDKMPIAVFENVWKLWKNIVPNKKRATAPLEKVSEPPAKKIKQNNLKNEKVIENKSTKKRKIAENTKVVNKKQILNEEIISEDTKESDSDESSDDECSNQEKVKSILPGPSEFWSTDLETLTKSNITNESSEDDDNDEINNIKKKKKITKAERFKLEKEEENRLRKIEENLANLNSRPETADQFDRLVLAKPNDSLTWINYMVFHLEATEIDKARTIARKALKTISFRETNELINVWVALLNLELSYGTKESFDDVLKEALLYNDKYKIYTRCLKILTDAKKQKEINEMINLITKKFKENPEIWISSAISYFEIGLPEKGKQLLQKALAILPERDHINIIVRFSNLYNKYGDKENAHSLFEQIISSFPKRVDVWSQYVDMLVKDQAIDSARQTLERAVSQKIPIKKMRTLFKKYLEFEERHGNEDNVNKVKEMAENYIKNEINS